jgi:transposase
MPLFAGLDWGSTGHAVCVVDDRGATVLRRDVRHDAAGLAALVAQLGRLGSPAALPVAIERPSGLVVETLLAAGHPVVPIHPNVVKACRPRYQAAGGKSDPGDAYLLADVLRTDGHRFRPLDPVSDAIRALRAMIRSRDDLVATRVGMANRLRSLLEGFWPGAAVIFTEIDCGVALAFLARFPTPQSAARLGPQRLAAFLARHRYPGRRTPDELLARLHAAPRGLAGPAEMEASGAIVQALVAALESIVAAIRALSRRIELAVADLPDGRIVMSFPRAGRICAAAILAEIGDVRGRFQTAEQLAAEAGVSPVTHASGKRRGVVFRFACNHRLRAAVTCWADNSRHASPWAADVYRRARARGCDHPHAIRVLARAWIRVLWRAWSDRAPYDPDRHTAARPILQTAGG